jgi:hypothetical protein
MKIIREIKTIGLKDWLWFVILLRKNEFHRSLNSISKKTVEKRDRAHRIDMKLRDMV